MSREEIEMRNLLLAVPCTEVWKALSPDGTYNGGRRARAWYRGAEKKARRRGSMTVDLKLQSNRWRDYGSDTLLCGNVLELVQVLTGWTPEESLEWLVDFANSTNKHVAA